MIYGIVKGTIIAKKVKTPENGKPHIQLQVLQPAVDDFDPQLCKIKDFDLNRKYPESGKFSAVCMISDWSFDSKSGQSVSVIKLQE